MDFVKAFVLNSIDYKENSKILYLYTNNGHQSVIAHGVKKMNSINRFLSQNGTLIRYTHTSTKFPSLKEGEIIKEFEHIKKDIVLYTYMNHINELVQHTISDDLQHEKMFMFMEKIFDRIDDGYDPELLCFVFELKLLHFLGYGLQLKQCAICSLDEELVFNTTNGGLVCKHHLSFKDKYFDASIYRYIQELYYIDIEQSDLPDISKNDRVILRHIIDLLYDEFISYKTKSRNILKQIKKY